MNLNKCEGIEPSVHTTTSDAGSLLRKSAAASGRPGSELEQPSMKVVIVKFGGAQEGVWGERKGMCVGKIWKPVGSTGFRSGCFEILQPAGQTEKKMVKSHFWSFLFKNSRFWSLFVKIFIFSLFFKFS